MACAQGNLEIVDLMFRRQPENVPLAISATDVCGMTPLHKAALFDRLSIVKLLLEQVLPHYFPISLEIRTPPF